MKVISLLLLLSFMGAANAAPVTIESRSEYSTSLNSIATVIMNWYGSLISDDSTVIFDTPSTHSWTEEWSEYRSHYPKHITNIQITNTQLLKHPINNDSNPIKYQFIVTSIIYYKNDNTLHSKKLIEEFTFKSPLQTNAQFEKKPIDKVILKQSKDRTPHTISGYQRPHYKAREFTYAWLSYLDNMRALKPTMNAKEWLDKASYSLTIGADKTKSTINSILQQRNHKLKQGGHLLRSLKVSKTSKQLFTLTLILEWKGLDPNNKPMLAKIRQILTIKVDKDGQWKVISIDEKHLLPTVAPWVGLLC